MNKDPRGTENIFRFLGQLSATSVFSMVRVPCRKTASGLLNAHSNAPKNVQNRLKKEQKEKVNEFRSFAGAKVRCVARDRSLDASIPVPLVGPRVLDKQGYAMHA